MTAAACRGVVSGFGAAGYILALRALAEILRSLKAAERALLNGLASSSSRVGDATLTKADVVDAVAVEAELSRRKAGEIVDLILNEIKGALQKGDRVALNPFGSFVVARAQAREGTQSEDRREDQHRLTKGSGLRRRKIVEGSDRRQPLAHEEEKI